MHEFVNRTGWLDTYKKYLKWKVADFHPAVIQESPRIPLGHKREHDRLVRACEIKQRYRGRAKEVSRKTWNGLQEVKTKFAANLNFGLQDFFCSLTLSEST